MLNNGDTKREFKVGTETVRGLGSFHKSLLHDHWGEVDAAAFEGMYRAAVADRGVGDAVLSRAD